MMSNCDALEDLMAEVLFGHPTDGDRMALELHLSGCAECRLEFSELEKTIGLSKSRVTVDPGEAFWAGFHDRLVERVLLERWTADQRDTSGRSATTLSRPGARNPQVRQLHVAQSGWVPRLAAAVLLVAVGFGIGKLASVPAPTGEGFARVGVGGDDARAELLTAEARVGELLSRSEIVLLQFVNEASDETSAARARELGRHAEMVRASLSGGGSRSMSELIRELEFVLLQIANLDAETDAPGVELVRNTIDRRALLFRINRQQLREMQSSSTTEPSSQTTPL